MLEMKKKLRVITVLRVNSATANSVNPGAADDFVRQSPIFQGARITPVSVIDATGMAKHANGPPYHPHTVMIDWDSEHWDQTMRSVYAQFVQLEPPSVEYL